MEENNIPQEGSSIDFMKIFKDLLKYKKLYLKVLGVAAVVAVIYTLSLPNYYKVTVKLSPELNSRRSSNSLSSMAQMFGINLSGAAGNTTEALFPTLYPDLMNSVTFHSSLFPIKVHRDKDDKMMTYYDYLLNEQKSPWWSQAIGATKGAIFSLFTSEKKKQEETEVNPFRLTPKQTAIVKSMKSRIVCDVDKKTMVITIDVVDQDPLIAATMADSVQQPTRCSSTCRTLSPTTAPRRRAWIWSLARRLMPKHRNAMRRLAVAMRTMQMPTCASSWRAIVRNRCA